jgi:D-alanyl-lipoteichoic acid acyltransferase DltB (MBOAT superfamily)
MCWRAEYALLMFFSILSTYVCALFTEKKLLGKRKFWLIINLVLNFSILFFFKYFNFVSQTITDIAKYINPAGLAKGAFIDVFLPVGISFYTFQAIGYTIDVYRGDIKAEKSFVDYALFVSFFPQLVAGPIERSKNLLPQLKERHKITYENFHTGLIRIFWGLFKKIVIADRLSVLVNYTYAAPFSDLNAAGYITAAAAFSFQIYCDFSAYSDIARGSANLFGYSLMKNFNAPYFSPSVKEFWRRWHISLSTWFKDYLYFPLGGSRKGKLRTYFNILVVFALSGLWHGASVTFIVWGLLNGAYQVIEDIWASINKKLKTDRIGEFFLFKIIGAVVTFALISYAFIFFRAQSVADALNITGKIFDFENLANLSFAGIAELGLSVPYLWVLAASLCLLAVVDFIGMFTDIAKKISRTVLLKYAAYFLLFVAIMIFGYYGSAYDPQEFIYFQF